MGKEIAIIIGENLEYGQVTVEIKFENVKNNIYCLTLKPTNSVKVHNNQR